MQCVPDEPSLARNAGDARDQAVGSDTAARNPRDDRMNS